MVAHSILPNVIVFKSAHGKYLSADKFGLVTATAEAVGPQQEWTPVFRDEGLALQSKYEKFLKFEDERNSVRADSEAAGFCEIFSVKCQAAHRAESRRKAQQKAAAEKSTTEVETEAAYAGTHAGCPWKGSRPGGSVQRAGGAPSAADARQSQRTRADVASVGRGLAQKTVPELGHGPCQAGAGRDRPPLCHARGSAGGRAAGPADQGQVGQVLQMSVCV